MLVILDTNIFVSALLTKNTPPYRIFWSWRAHKFDLATCPEQLAEIRRVSGYARFRSQLQPHRVGTMINYLLQEENFDNLKITEQADDPDDSWLLALAEASRAHFLVTGDMRAGILERRSAAQAEVITATDFCHRLGI